MLSCDCNASKSFDLEVDAATPTNSCFTHLGATSLLGVNPLISSFFFWLFCWVQYVVGPRQVTGPRKEVMS